MQNFLGYQQGEPVPERLTPIVQVRLELRSRPGVYLTTAALVELTGLSRIQVASAVYALSKQRKIDRRLPASRAGRNSGQAYKWRDGATVCPNCGRETGPSRTEA
jgi:hypothetical protein